MWLLPTKTLDGTSEDPNRILVSNNEVPAVIGWTFTIHLWISIFWETCFDKLYIIYYLIKQKESVEN